MIWCNGVVRPHGETRIAPDDRGFTLGDGLFETIRVRHGGILHASRHLRRLRHGAGVLGIAVSRDDPAILLALRQTLRANGIDDGSLRLTLSRGPAGRGIDTRGASAPTMLISAAGSAAATAPPVRLVTATSTRRNEFSPLSAIKSLNYLDGILARREAEALGADDALLLGTRGHLAEATTASLVVLQDGALLTPPVADGALPGIARGLLIEHGLLCERRLDPDQARQAASMFLCNSLGIRAVASFEARALLPRPDLMARMVAILVTPEPSRPPG